MFEQAPIPSTPLEQAVESLARTVVEQQHTIRLLTENVRLLRQDQVALQEEIGHVRAVVDRLEACQCHREVSGEAMRPAAKRRASTTSFSQETQNDVLRLLREEARPLAIRVIAHKLNLSQHYIRKVVYAMYNDVLLGRDDENRYFPEESEALSTPNTDA